MKKYQVVFYIDECGKAKADLVMKNIENLIADLGEKNLKIELVANGEALI